MVSSGISLEDAVKIVNQQSSSSALRNILTQIEEELYKGALFSDALAKFPKVFPSYFRNMIYIGEVSGQIATVLKKAADFYEKDEKMKRKASTAMVYPTFLFIAIIAVFIFLLMFIVPRFEETLTQMDTELPRITQIIISISDFISTNFIFIIIFVLVFVFLVWLWFKQN